MILCIMSRFPRLEIPGALYHVTVRGTGVKIFLRAIQDRQRFLLVLRQVIARFNWMCFAWCLMSTSLADSNAGCKLADRQPLRIAIHNGRKNHQEQRLMRIIPRPDPVVFCCSPDLSPLFWPRYLLSYIIHFSVMNNSVFCFIM